MAILYRLAELLNETEPRLVVSIHTDLAGESAARTA